VQRPGAVGACYRSALQLCGRYGTPSTLEAFKKTGAETLKPSNSSAQITSDRPHFLFTFATVDGSAAFFDRRRRARRRPDSLANPGSAKDGRVSRSTGGASQIVAFDRPWSWTEPTAKHGDATLKFRRACYTMRSSTPHRAPDYGRSFLGGALALVHAISLSERSSGLSWLRRAAYEARTMRGFWPACPRCGYRDAANYVLAPLLQPGRAQQLKKAFSPDPVPPGYERTVLSNGPSRESKGLRPG